MQNTTPFKPRPGRRPAIWLAAVLLQAALLPLPQARADVSQELKDEVSAAEIELRDLEKTKGTPVGDLIAVRGRLGRLCSQADWQKKAEEHWKKVAELFTKAKLPGNGGPEATWAAEAQFGLLQSRVAAALESKPALRKGQKGAPGWQAALTQWSTDTAGTPIAGTTERLPGRRGGVAGALEIVSDLRAPEWTTASVIQQARLVGYAAEVLQEWQPPADLTADLQANLRDHAKKISAELAVQAPALVEAAWAEVERRNLNGRWRTECKREMNRYSPAQHPLSRMRGKSWLTPVAETLQKQVEAAGMLADVHACYDRHLVVSPDEMLGEVSLQWLLLPDGSAELRQVDHADARITSCLRKRWAGKTEFPHDAAPIEIRVRLEFAAL